MEKQLNWASLPGDLLTSIGELLDVPSRICFRAVCRHWRASIQEEEAGAMPSPWIVVPDVEGCSDSFTLISAPTMKSFRWATPGGVPARCVGSNGGWLAMVTVVDSQHIGISLVNPLTDARVELPHVTGWQEVPPPYLSTTWRMGYETPPITSWELDAADPHDCEVLLDTVVRKVVFSPSPSAQDYAVAIASRAGEIVMYTTSAINCWRNLRKLPPNGNRRRELDLAYHDGKFYFMTTSGMVYVIDITCADVQPYPAPVWLRFFQFGTSRVPWRCRGYHLAFSGDGALHVGWSHSLGDDTMSQIRIRGCPEMYVMRYEAGTSLWKRATTLGGRAFLIGDRNQTLSVPADGSSEAWLRSDSVYFANTPFSYLRTSGVQGRRGMWVYDLGTLQVLPANVEKDIAELEPNVDWPKSLWFTPRFR